MAWGKDLFDRIVSLLTVLLLGAAIYVYGYQAKIMKLQAEISERQARLTDEQKLISERQLQLVTRPYLSTKIESDSKDVVAAKLLVRNQGVFPVRNLRLDFLYFAKITDHGWWVTAPSGGQRHERLAPNEEWTLDISGYGKTVGRAFSNSFVIQGNLEVVVFLVSFEREIDG